MNASEKARGLLEKLDFMEDFMDDDGEIFDLKQTIVFTDLPASLQQEIKETYYGSEYSDADIENQLFVQQCVSIDTSGKEPIIKHVGFYVYDEDVKLDNRYPTSDCQAGADWISLIDEKLHTTMD